MSCIPNDTIHEGGVTRTWEKWAKHEATNKRFTRFLVGYTGSHF